MFCRGMIGTFFKVSVRNVSNFWCACFQTSCLQDPKYNLKTHWEIVLPKFDNNNRFEFSNITSDYPINENYITKLLVIFIIKKIYDFNGNNEFIDKFDITYISTDNFAVISQFTTNDNKIPISIKSNLKIKSNDLFDTSKSSENSENNIKIKYKYKYLLGYFTYFALFNNFNTESEITCSQLIEYKESHGFENLYSLKIEQNDQNACLIPLDQFKYLPSIINNYTKNLNILNHLKIWTIMYKKYREDQQTLSSDIPSVTIDNKVITYTITDINNFTEKYCIFLLDYALASIELETSQPNA